MKLSIATDQSIPMYRRVFEAIQQAVASQVLVPGAKLPPQAVLARELNVHATTIRTAYELLEKQGVVVSRRGSGTFVSETAVTSLLKQQGRSFGSIHVVIGHKHLTHIHRDRRQILGDILVGLDEGLGDKACRQIHVESFTPDCLGDVPDDGAVLVWLSHEFDAELYEQLQERGIPVVAAWGHSNGLPFVQVKHDPYEAVALGCRHLVDCGYQRIGFIGEKGRSLELGLKFMVFSNVLFDAGLDYQIKHVRDVREVPGHAYAATLSILENDPPEAFFVDTDWKAMEVIAAIRDAGLNVPEDIGVVGYDGIIEGAEFVVPLTTVLTPRVEIGRAAARLFLNWPKGQSQQGQPLPAVGNVSPRLIVRHSTRIVGPSVDHSASTEQDISASMK